MPDYSTMYHHLFNVQTDAIKGLQSVTQKLIEAQQLTEEMYINSAKPTLLVLDSKQSEADNSDK